MADAYLKVEELERNVRDLRRSSRREPFCTSSWTTFWNFRLPPPMIFPMILRSGGTRSATNTLNKRFCFDITLIPEPFKGASSGF